MLKQYFYSLGKKMGAFYLVGSLLAACRESDESTSFQSNGEKNGGQNSSMQSIESELGISGLGGALSARQGDDPLLSTLLGFLEQGAVKEPDSSIFLPTERAVMSVSESVGRGSQTMQVADSQRKNAFLGAARTVLATLSDNVRRFCQNNQGKFDQIKRCHLAIAPALQAGAQSADNAAIQVTPQLTSIMQPDCQRIKFIAIHGVSPLEEVRFTPEPPAPYMEVAFGISRVINNSAALRDRPPLLPGEWQSTNIKYPANFQSRSEHPEANVVTDAEPIFTAVEKEPGVFYVSSSYKPDPQLFRLSWSGELSIAVRSDGVVRGEVGVHLPGGGEGRSVPIGVIQYPFDFLRDINPQSVDLSSISFLFLNKLKEIQKQSEALSWPYFKFVPDRPFCYGYFSNQYKRTPSGMVFLFGPPKDPASTFGYGTSRTTRR